MYHFEAPQENFQHTHTQRVQFNKDYLHITHKTFSIPPYSHTYYHKIGASQIKELATDKMRERALIAPTILACISNKEHVKLITSNN